jgi:predicted alpha/beta hydrolase
MAGTVKHVEGKGRGSESTRTESLLAVGLCTLGNAKLGWWGGYVSKEMVGITVWPSN